MKTRNHYSAEHKAKVVLEVLREEAHRWHQKLTST